MYFCRIFVGLILSFVQVIAGQQSPPELQALIDSVSMTNLANHIKALQYAGGYYSRVNFTPGNDSAAAYIERTFAALPYLASVECDTFYIASAASPLNSKPILNVVATVQGKKYPSKIYLIGAHLDCSASRMSGSTWDQQWRTIRAPGADDNASGVAAILELARLMSDSTLGFSTDYTLRFVAFGAEESGPAYPGAISHPGSSHYVQAAKARGDNILGMISIDMIGFNETYEYLSIISNSASTWLGQAIVTANDSNAIGLLTNKPPFPSATYSDHNSFWIGGYPAICLIENAPPWNNSPYYKANPYYHTSADSFETVNMPLVRKVTQVTLAAIATLSGTFTGIGEPDDVTGVPQTFVLYQNYPNPFNPTTIVRYQVPRVSHVEIVVSDLLGRELVTLASGERSAGTYETIWDASGQASGMYFYRLECTSSDGRSLFHQVRRMLLLR